MAVLLITDLPPDALGHVLARLPYADQIARAAMSCKGFKAAAKLAEDMRVAASPVPLPPQLRTVYALEPRLRVLRWAEAVGSMAKTTLSGADESSVCISPRDGALCASGNAPGGELHGSAPAPVEHAMEHAEPGAAKRVPVTKPPKKQNPYLLHSEFQQSGSPLVHVAGGGHGGLYIDPEREYKLRLMRHQHEMGKAPETHEAIFSLAGIR